MDRHRLRMIGTWLAIIGGLGLAGAGLFALKEWIEEAQREFVAAPLWPRPDGSVSSRARAQSFDAVWDHDEELQSVGAGRAA